MFNKHFFLNKFTIVLILVILSNCQLKKATKNHGILFLENRFNKLQINKSNMNDVIRIVGTPHTKSITDDQSWIYIERILAKGEYHKLGKNLVLRSNVMVLDFDKFGILKDKNIYDKNKIANIKFSKDITVNNLSQRSFIQEFLQSIRTKMYGNRK